MINYDTIWQGIPEGTQVNVKDFSRMVHGDENKFATETNSRYDKAASYFLTQKVKSGLAYRDYSLGSKSILYIKDEKAGSYSQGFKIAHTWNTNIGKTLTTKQLTDRVKSSFKGKISSCYMTKMLNEICHANFGTKKRIGKSNTYYLDVELTEKLMAAITVKLRTEIADGFKKSADKAVKGASKESGSTNLTEKYSKDDDITEVPTEKLEEAKGIIDSNKVEIADLKTELSEVLDEVVALKAELRNRPKPKVDNMDWLK